MLRSQILLQRRRSPRLSATTRCQQSRLIMPGTTIGKGCMVSAYSYVNGVFPDFSIIAGNPAVVTGDTRKLDQPYLDLDPDLKKWYNQWSQ